MDVFHSAPTYNGINEAAVYSFYNSGTFADFSFKLFVPTSGQTSNDFEDAAEASRIAYATAHSYTVSNVQKWYPLPATITRTGMMSATDKVKLDALSGGSFKSYQALISQTGGSAPSATNLVSDFGAVTFTWARTNAGIYTVTASSAVFTSGKTAVLITDPSNALWAFRPVVTSTTVITITTSVLAVLAVVLGATNTDGLLSGNLVEVRVFP